jgi:hypothetical protein
MKKILPIILMTFLICQCSNLLAQSFDTPVQYMEYIGKQQENTTKKFMSYASAAAHGKRARKVEKLRVKLLDEVQESKMNIASMPSYKGNKDYRDSSVNFLKLYYNVLNDDYSKIVNMEDIAEQSYDDMEAFMLIKETVDKKLEEGNDKIKIAQTKFAAANNITLNEGKSELGEMMKEMHEMNKYYKVIYLYFFKPYKQEVYMMEATAKANITGIEQNKNSLLKYAQEGLEKLKTIQSYKGDNSLISSCKSILNFYVKEADKMTATSDYLLAKERFEKIKKEYEKKSDHSKEEVATYNNAVNEMNKAVNVSNSNGNMLNQMRTETLNEWNKSVDNFFDEHTPHYK